jgi:hypothetical protein
MAGRVYKNKRKTGKKANAMYTVLILLALSAVSGLALASSFSWYAIAMSGVVLAGLSAAALHVAGFGALSGIVLIVACLTCNQLAYVAGLLSRGPDRATRKSIERARDAEAVDWSRSHQLGE